MPTPPRTDAPVITFLGATGTVTGSRYLITTAHATVLVDGGLFQGSKELRLRNRDAFALDPARIDAVVLTHAHVDHSGYLPALAARGFAGPIYATAGTVALASIVLPDSGHLQEEEAAFAAARGYSRHHPPRPLYTEDDARRMLPQLRATPFGSSVEVAAAVRVRFRRAGHILGSASVVLEADDLGSIAFSGDLGRDDHPILRAPEPPEAVGDLVVESTYGDRSHGDDDGIAALAAVINRTAARGGTVIVPSFAVDRTEVMLHHLQRLMASGAVPSLPVYVDSPMALAALDVYRRAIAEGWEEIRPELRGATHDPFELPKLVRVRTVEESKRLGQLAFPSIIVSASGMATGGRVLHHLAQHLPNGRDTVVLPGFQAEGTRGRALVDGAHQIKMLGRYVPVRADVVSLPMFSVHADADELLAWMARSPSAPDTVFVVHGEPAASSALRARIEAELGWNAVIPVFGERVRLAARRLAVTA